MFWNYDFQTVLLCDLMGEGSPEKECAANDDRTRESDNLQAGSH